MSTQPTDSRFDFNPSFASVDYTKYKDFYQYLGATVIVLILITIGAILFADIQPRINDIITGISGYLTNVYTEIISVVVTILILDRRAEKREENRRVDERNHRLVREIGSQDNATAIKAIREATELGLLKGDDGLLQNMRLRSANLAGAKLARANLSDVQLARANLEGADLRGTNLQNTDLILANLQGAYLGGSNLRGADLGGSNLESAYLREANLQNVDLRGANLQSTDLRGANLQGTDLDGTQFNEKTNLPNNSKWGPETDMTRFTDPQHPDFWQPIWAGAGFDSWYDWIDAGKPIAPDNPTRD